MVKHRPTFYKGKLGQYFRGLRENRGWTLSRAVFLARQRKLSVGLSALKWLEGGLTRNPEPELLRALSTLYGEPYGSMVQEVAKHVYAIKLRQLLEGTTLPTSVEGFVALPLLARPITSGQPLEITVDPHRDSRLAFRHDFIKRLTRPVVLRVGKKDASMTPTIEADDVVLIDQNLARRRRPTDGQIYAINTGPLTGQDGGTLQRVEFKGGTLILSSDHLDKSAHPTRTFAVKVAILPEVLVGEVVWYGRSLGRGTRR